MEVVLIFAVLFCLHPHSWSRKKWNARSPSLLGKGKGSVLVHCGEEQVQGQSNSMFKGQLQR